MGDTSNSAVDQQEKTMKKSESYESDSMGIKNELSAVRFNLSRHDRRILAFYFGYLDVKNKRKAKKDKNQACLFVKEALFPGSLFNGEMDRAFCLETDIDWVRFKQMPGIFNKDRESVELFLLNGADEQLSDLQECSFIRSYQTFGRCLPQQLFVKETGYLIILLLGRVSFS